jgi:hypothetical protein
VRIVRRHAMLTWEHEQLDRARELEQRVKELERDAALGRKLRAQIAGKGA